MKWTFWILASFGVFCILGWVARGNTVSQELAIPPLMLIKNMDNVKTLPKNFRMSSGPWHESFGAAPSRAGLNNLKISGSAQFSEQGLNKLIETIPADKIIFVDLREESHGFLDGIAVGWYYNHNWEHRDMPEAAIEQIQALRLKEAAHRGYVSIFADKNSPEPQSLHLSQALTEKELISKLHTKAIEYVRFYVTDHHRPTDETVDAFVEFVKTIPQDVWVHFHCKAGRGRTTTFMTMFDMMHNAHNVSKEEIIKRQFWLGGVNLKHIQEEKLYKQAPSAERLKFIDKFYEYCKANPRFDVTWSTWVKLKSKG